MQAIFSKLLIICTLLFAVNSLSAQIKQGNEIGVWGGGAYSKNDLNTSFNHIASTREGAGAFFRLNFHDRWSWKNSFNYSFLQGADSISNTLYQNQRNLSFRNKTFDLASTIEFNFIPRKRSRKRGQFQHFTPYLFAGIALVYHNPQASFNDEWVDLRPLGTEGQQFPELSGVDPYGRLAIAVPIGGGFKYFMAKHWAIGLEVSYRKTFTDYLDDVSTRYTDNSIFGLGETPGLSAALADRSGLIDPPIGIPGRQRGDSQHNDEYVSFGFSISYVFARMICPSPKW